ncbi:MAG: SDR family oxidoreductase [Armatimonadota bacterium]
MSSMLAGKTALVTGAAKRIGRAIALALACSGANVVIHYRNSEPEARELAQKIESVGVRAWCVKADLAVSEELERLVDRACSSAGTLDILVNSASIFPTSDFNSVSSVQLAENIQVNAWAPFVLARHFARQADSGHIINILDSRITGYDWSHVAYHASKYLLELFTRMMAIQYAPNIAVNAVAPGLILPPEGKDDSYLEQLKQTLPLKRVGSTRDVTDTVLFLVASRFITGQVIFVDGGRHLAEAGGG